MINLICSEVLRDAKRFQGWIDELISQVAADPALKTFSRPENRTCLEAEQVDRALMLYGQVAESLTEAVCRWSWNGSLVRTDIVWISVRRHFMNLTGIIESCGFKLLDGRIRSFCA